jgi:Xaa-Pro aminopeptidase
MPIKELQFYQNIFPRKELRDCSALIAELRAVKSPWETARMEAAADLSLRTFEYLRTIIRPDMDKMELGTRLETFSRQHGHSGKLRVRDYQNEAYAWQIHVSQELNHRNPKLLPNNVPILIELSTVLNGYHISESRLVVMGSLPAKAQAANQAVIQIHNTVLEKAKPGMHAQALYEIAIAEAKHLGYEDVFLGLPGNKSKFIGHGIGAELIEPPFLSADEEKILQPGMTITLEPYLIFKDEFITGLVDVFLITATGTRLLTHTPVQIIAC